MAEKAPPSPVQSASKLDRWCGRRPLLRSADDAAAVTLTEKRRKNEARARTQNRSRHRERDVIFQAFPPLLVTFSPQAVRGRTCPAHCPSAPPRISPRILLTSVVLAAEPRRLSSSSLPPSLQWHCDFLPRAPARSLLPRHAVPCLVDFLACFACLLACGLVGCLVGWGEKERRRRRKRAATPATAAAPGEVRWVVAWLAHGFCAAFAFTHKESAASRRAAGRARVTPQPPQRRRRCAAPAYISRAPCPCSAAARSLAPPPPPISAPRSGSIGSGLLAAVDEHGALRRHDDGSGLQRGRPGRPAPLAPGSHRAGEPARRPGRLLEERPRRGAPLHQQQGHLEAAEGDAWWNSDMLSTVWKLWDP